MKLRDGFLVHNMGNDTILIAVGDAMKDFSGLVRLNETAAFIVRRLMSPTDEDQIVEALLAEYAVDRDTAATHVRAVLRQLREINALKDEN